MRGRKRELHDPVRTSIWVEKSDRDAAKATKLSDATIYRQGLKYCVLTQRTRPEVLEKLAVDEDRMAEDHESSAAAHRHRAEEFRTRITDGRIVPNGPQGRAEVR
jgi:hypothetical protein